MTDVFQAVNVTEADPVEEEEPPPLQVEGRMLGENFDIYKHWDVYILDVVHVLLYETWCVWVSPELLVEFVFISFWSIIEFLICQNQIPDMKYNKISPGKYLDICYFCTNEVEESKRKSIIFLTKELLSHLV